MSLAKASSSRASSSTLKRRSDDGVVDYEESIETIEYADGATPAKIPLLSSGKDLMDNFGGSTKIFKQHLPHNTLFMVTGLKAVEVHGTDQAVYMDAKLLMQAVHEEDHLNDGGMTPNDDEEEQPERDERIIITNF